MNTGRFLLIVLISFVCTYFLRALPFLAFSGDRKMPDWLDRLGKTLPSAIMAVLIVVCITLRIVSQKKMQMIAYRKGEILFMDRKDTVIAQMPSYALNEAEINTWKVKIPWDGRFYLIERNPFDNGDAVKEMLHFFGIEEQ